MRASAILISHAAGLDAAEDLICRKEAKMRKNRICCHCPAQRSCAVLALLLLLLASSPCQAQSTVSSQTQVVASVTNATLEANTSTTLGATDVPYEEVTDSGTQLVGGGQLYAFETESNYAGDMIPTDFPDLNLLWPAAANGFDDDIIPTPADDRSCTNPYYTDPLCSCVSCYNCYCPNVAAADGLQSSTAGQADDTTAAAEATAAADGTFGAVVTAAALSYGTDSTMSDAAIALAVFAAVLMICLVIAMGVFIFVAVNGKVEIGRFRFQLRGATPVNGRTGSPQRHHHRHHRATHHHAKHTPAVVQA